jgi:hypothetical protein
MGIREALEELFEICESLDDLSSEINELNKSIMVLGILMMA